MKKLITNNVICDQRSFWTVAIYGLLSFFVLGVSAMLYFFIYLKFDCVQKNIDPYMKVFHNHIVFLFYIPSILLLISTLLLFYFAPKNFSKTAIIAASLLSLIAVGTIFLFLIPLQNSYISTTGFTAENYNKLLFYSLHFQLIPIFLQSLIALLFLNKFLLELKPFTRWLFIIVFFLAFYTAGSDFAEKCNYPTWLTFDKNSWLTFRNSHHSIFFLFGYLMPAFLPLVIVPLLFWFRSKAIKVKFVWFYLLLYLFIAVVSGIYFVPKLQMQLNKNYSTFLIKKLINNDLVLRVLPGLFIYFLAFYMLVLIKKSKQIV